jgi:signal peptidase I
MVRKPRTRWPVYAGILVILGILAGGSMFRVYAVHGSSDVPTFRDGDFVLAHLSAYDLRLPFTRFCLGHLSDPLPGEVILFEIPGGARSAFKRVVGIPGDRIEIRDSRVIRNGRELRYDPVDRDTFPWASPLDRMGDRVEMESLGRQPHPVTYSRGGSRLARFGPLVVPENAYFVLGDNRDFSEDSRTYGPVPRGSVRGRILGRLFERNRR